ncbi:MAG TPA: hypothetical protein VF810_00270 [Patescibacteria group bacterium]
MKKETLIVLALVILGIAGYNGYKYYIQQKSFEQKLQCHDEAVKYVDNKRATYEKQIKLDNSSQSFAFINDAYNKDLNTCLVYYSTFQKTDNVKYHSLGDSFWQNIDDVLTGKNLDWWETDYKVNSYDINNSTGQIRGKDISNEKDFGKEVEALFGVKYYIPPQVPSPTPSYWFDNLTPTPTQQSYNQNFYNVCSSGNIYCTCLYDVLHRIDAGNETADYLAERGNGNNAPMINAYAECNSRFSSK